MHVCKTPVALKPAHPNIDNTDSEEDLDSDKAAIIPTDAGMDKWQAYLNTIEDIPAGLGIVYWWGVCDLGFCACIIGITNVSTL